jgi:molybdopterin-dependent oxidoreductase alpha subunit
VFKALLEEPSGIDADFVRTRTSGFEAAASEIRAQPWDELERRSGASRGRMKEFAKLLIRRPRANFVWSMGLTQHAHGVGTVRALVNVGLARGIPGRPNCGLMPIRGHSGVQGGAEVGCAPVVDRATAARWSEVCGFPPPLERGLTAVEQVAAAAGGEIDAFWMVGGNFLETLPDRARSLSALERPALRIHQDIALSSACVVPASGAVLLLPAATRYETPGGVTETSTERRVIFSPEIPGPRIPGARPEWEVLAETARRARPETADRLKFDSTAAIRDEIARAVPLYRGIERLAAAGDQFQWGGERLFADGLFATPDGRARFVPVPLPRESRPAGAFVLSTRRGKQFNSMVQRPRDPLTGADRHAVFVSESDASRLGLREGDPVRLVSEFGEMLGRAKIARIKEGNLEVHWPEGNRLLSTAIDPESLEPDYNVEVRLERWDGVETGRAAAD